MTQANNLALLANNLNTSGQVDATDGLNGLLANSNLASSGTADATTYLRGDRTWATISQRFRQILQVQSTTTVTTSSLNTWVSTNLSQAITPSSASSQIMCLVHCPIRFGSSNGMQAGIRIKRGSTVIITDTYLNNVNAIVDISYGINLSYLDAPATTSSTTYSVEFALTGSASPYTYPTICWNTTSSPITLIVMEIAP